MLKKINTYLLIALGIGIIFHGSTIFFTLERSYDALIHLFFAEHYASNWFEPWNYKWYTGFTVVCYPPLVHQLLGLLSFIGGFKFAMYLLAFFIIVLFISGVYRYSLILTKNENYAGFAALFAVFSSAFIETLHIYGQLPTLMGMSLLFHGLPEIYKWIVFGKLRNLVASLIIIAITVSSHHVTPIFGMVFFIFPLIGLALMDLSKKQVGTYKAITLKVFIQSFIKSFKKIVGFGLGSLVLIVFCILPYWINTKNNPITQVPIPHGSRDNYLEVLSSGLMFFIIPYGIILLLFPFIFYKLFTRRTLFFGLSFSMLVLLGTGGTTPLPKMILGENAFSILTLDRFTFWATMMSMPIVGEFFYRLFKTDIKDTLLKKYRKAYYVIGCTIIGLITAFFAVFTLTLGEFRPSQPDKIKMLPIVNFLNQDQHYKWRYLTLGFGDQMALLGLETKALSVDGNYNSARQLPELTTRAVERLENCKFKGIEGIGSLQQFLAYPEKFNLKYIFSNDKFYDPILYFTGWQRLAPLENGIVVWEKQNVKPLSRIIPKKELPTYQRIIWGIVPVGSVVIALLFFGYMFMSKKSVSFTLSKSKELPNRFTRLQHIWCYVLFVLSLWGSYKLYLSNNPQETPIQVLNAYYNAMDFKVFEEAHSYLDPAKNKSLDQFMLEISVTDGLLSSYAKLDGITHHIISKNNNSATIESTTSWITPLEVITNTEIHTLIKRKQSWYIEPKAMSSEIPQNQFFTENTTVFYNQGRRKVSTEQTYHDDILPQPVLKVLSAKLIQRDSSYHIIGEIQNIDHFPADISFKATVLDAKEVPLATFSTKLATKHKLNPMETTAFRIDFEETAWVDINESASGTFDPNEFHKKEFKSQPVSFILHASSTVATKDLYQNLHLNKVTVNNERLSGNLFNSGTKEVTIPETIISYYKDQSLVWVDHNFIKESIRPHRTGIFDFQLIKDLQIDVINDDYKNTYVNGILNEIASADKLKDYQYESLIKDVITIENNTGIKLSFNNFIGKL